MSDGEAPNGGVVARECPACGRRTLEMVMIVQEHAVDASPEHLWRVLLAVIQWPEWCGLVQLVEPERTDDPLAGDLRINGMLGRIPYTATMVVDEHRPVELLRLISVHVSPPYQYIEHEIELQRGEIPQLTWRALYSLAGGPGGWLVDRLMVRRHVGAQLQRALEQLETGAT